MPDFDISDHWEIIRSEGPVLCVRVKDIINPIGYNKEHILSSCLESKHFSVHKINSSGCLSWVYNICKYLSLVANLPSFFSPSILSIETGYFMYFNTSAGSMNDAASLESRILYPKRGFQCLEFYYYNSGSESDQLNILIKEYTEGNPNGTLRLVKTIQGMTKPLSSIHIAYVVISNWDDGMPIIKPLTLYHPQTR